jgi:hypothetical protein
MVKEENDRQRMLELENRCAVREKRYAFSFLSSPFLAFRADESILASSALAPRALSLPPLRFLDFSSSMPFLPRSTDRKSDALLRLDRMREQALMTALTKWRPFIMAGAEARRFVRFFLPNCPFHLPLPSSSVTPFLPFYSPPLSLPSPLLQRLTLLSTTGCRTPQLPSQRPMVRPYQSRFGTLQHVHGKQRASTDLK